MISHIHRPKGNTVFLSFSFASVCYIYWITWMNSLVTPPQYVFSWRHFALSYAQCSCCPVTVNCVVDVENKRRDDGWSWIHILAGARDFFFSKTPISALGPNKPPNRWLTELSPEKAPLAQSWPLNILQRIRISGVMPSFFDEPTWRVEGQPRFFTLKTRNFLTF